MHVRLDVSHSISPLSLVQASGTIMALCSFSSYVLLVMIAQSSVIGVATKDYVKSPDNGAKSLLTIFRKHTSRISNIVD